MPHRVYIGPHDEVELPEIGVVRRGDRIEVPSELVEQLDEQPSNWAKPNTNDAKNAPKPAEPPAPEPPQTLDGQPIETTPDQAEEADQ